MTNDRPVLITGATGNTGQPLVEGLLEHRVPVRAMVRSEQSSTRLPAAVEAVLGDFDQPDSLTRALDGVRAAYLVTPSSERAEAQQVRFVELAAAAGVEQVVVLSQLAAAEESPVRFLRYHGRVEREVRESGLGCTFLRPNLFFQGLLALADAVKNDGRLFAPIGDARVSALDVRDIGAVAAASFTDDRHLGQTYTLTGPAAITHREIAAALSQAVGKPITFVDVPPEAFGASLQGVLPPWQVDGLLEDYAHYAAGEAAEVSPAIEDVTGRAPRSVHDFAHDYAAAFGAA